MRPDVDNDTICYLWMQAFSEDLGISMRTIHWTSKKSININTRTQMFAL